MSSALTLFARRSPLVAARRLPSAAQFATRVALSTNVRKVNETLASKPTADYYGSTHMKDEFRVLDEMLEKNLHIDFTDKAELKSIMEGANKAFAVEAPNGDGDWLVKQELQEIQKLIGQSQKHTPEERAKFQASMEKVKQMVKEAERITAVDAPDGASDADYSEELRRVQAILDHSKKATPEQREELQARMARMKTTMAEAEHTAAVDAPDGESDGHIQEELTEIRKIIDDAALHEDKDFVKYEHKMEDAVRKERARDPEHDW
jgi:hypothetical protein